MKQAADSSVELVQLAKESHFISTLAIIMSNRQTSLIVHLQ